MESQSLEAYAEHIIGGGWGSDLPDFKNSERVAIIRGTDIPKLQIGIYESVPIRYESIKKIQARKLQEGDLVIEISGGSSASSQYTGRTLLITEEIISRLGGLVIPASFCKLLRLDKNKIDPRYVAYQIDLMHRTGEISKYELQSTGISNFQFSHFLSDFKPSLSSLDEQRTAASILATIDRKISELRQANDLIYRIVFGLYRSWFLNFDPINYSLANNLLKYEKYPKSMSFDSVGEIPSGWGRVKFGELLDGVIGGDWGSDIPVQDENQQVAIVRGTDLPDLKNNISNKIPIRYSTLKKVSNRLLQEGDIVIEVSGGSKDQPTGRSFFFSDTVLDQFKTPVVPASFCRRFRPKSIPVGLFLYCHLNEIYKQGKMWEYQVQSTGISNFQTKQFLEQEVLVFPSPDVLERFFSIAYPLIRRAGHSEIQDLSRMKSGLLAKVISGDMN